MKYIIRSVLGSLFHKAPLSRQVLLAYVEDMNKFNVYKKTHIACTYKLYDGDTLDNNHF